MKVALVQQDNKNGYFFEANNVNSLKKAMKKIISKSPDELTKMGEISNQLAQQISPTTWAQTIFEITRHKTSF